MNIKDITIDEHDKITGITAEMTSKESKYLVGFALNMLYRADKLFYFPTASGGYWKFSSDIEEGMNK